MKFSRAFFVLFSVLLAVSGCHDKTATPQKNARPQTTVTTNDGIRAPVTPRAEHVRKTEGCTRHGMLPDPDCTPGTVFADVTKEQVCTPGYATAVRKHMPRGMRLRVFQMYGDLPGRPGTYEVDHLISLELGGSNDVTNLWPELAEPRPGFHEKDAVENYLHREVCAGRMSLTDAQHAIATDWYSVYPKIHGN